MSVWALPVREGETDEIKLRVTCVGIESRKGTRDGHKRTGSTECWAATLSLKTNKKRVSARKKVTHHASRGEEKRTSVHGKTSRAVKYCLSETAYLS